MQQRPIAGVGRASICRKLITDQDVLESAANADGARQWQISRRPDGLFEYREFTLDDEIYWVHEDGSETDVAAPSR